MAGAVSKEMDRLRLLVEACTCKVCYAQPVSVEACTNVYTHAHIYTQTCMCTDNTTKNIHHILYIVTTHQDHIIYTCTLYITTAILIPLCIIIKNTTQLDEYSSYCVPALVSHVPRITFLCAHRSLAILLHAYACTHAVSNVSYSYTHSHPFVA